MATFNQVSTLGSSTATTTHTMASQSVSSLTNGVGIFIIERNDTSSSANVITGATWGGNAMTLITSVPNTTTVTRLHMYAIVNPPTGTVSITATSSVNINTAMWWLTVNNGGTPEANNSQATTNSTTNTLSVTTITNNALIVGGGVSRANSNTPTADTGTTIQFNNSNAWFAWTEPAPTAGAITSGYTGLSSSADSTAIVVSIPDNSPVATINPAFLLNFI